MGVPFTPGELTTQQARHLNEITRTVEQFARLSVAPPLSLTRPAGIPSIRLTGDILDSDLLLAEVVSSTGTPPVHTVKLKTRKITSVINTVVDVTPTVTVTQVLNPLEATWPAGTLVAIFPIPEYEDWWWGIPIAADNGGGGAGADCEGHGWIIDADAIADAATDNDPDRVLHVTILAGVGRCACIERQPALLAVPNYFTAIRNTTTGLWHVLDMIDTCCSCGRMTIEFTGDDGSTLADYIPVEGILELLAACDAGTKTYYFRKMCATETTFELAGHGPKLCDDDPDPIPCDNTFRALVECADCDLANVVCGVCCGCEAPPYYFFNLSGFSGGLSYLNGLWPLPFTTECVWGFTCGGLTMSYSIALDGADVLLTFTISGIAVYELTITNVNTIDCSINRTLARVSGDSGTTPASVVAQAFSCEPLNNACYGGETPSAFLVTFHDCTSAFACLNGLEYTLTPDSSDACGAGTTGYSGVVADSCMDPGNPGYLALCCVAGCQYRFIFDIPPCDVFGECVLLDTTNCDPLTQEWRFTNLCALGQAFFTVTAIP